MFKILDFTNFFNFQPQPAEQIEDIIAIVISLFLLLGIACFPLLLFLKYSKPAVRVKQPMLLSLMAICLIFWMIGGFFTYRLLGGKSLVLCHISCIWFFHYGILGFLSLLIVRVHNLSILKVDVSLSSKQTSSWKNFCRWLSGFGLGVLLFLLIGAVNLGFTLTNSVRFDKERDSCFFEHPAVPFRVLCFYVWMFFLVVCTLFNLRIRRELRESTYLFIGVILMAVGITVVMLFTLLGLHYVRGVRILTCCAPPLLYCLYFMVSLAGRSVFSIITCNDQYFDNWLEKFQSNSVQRMLEEHLMDMGLTDDEDISLASEDGPYDAEMPSEEEDVYLG